jgi:hypothetical protein
VGPQSHFHAPLYISLAILHTNKQGGMKMTPPPVARPAAGGPGVALRALLAARRPVLASPGWLSAPSIFHSKSVLYGAFVRAHRALERPKWRFLARAVLPSALRLPVRPGALPLCCHHARSRSDSRRESLWAAVDDATLTPPSPARELPDRIGISLVSVKFSME